MYSVTDKYNRLINEDLRTVGIQVNVKTRNGDVWHFDDSSILQGSLYVNSRCVSNDDIELGSTYASELGVSIKYTGDMSRLKDAEITARFFLYDKNGAEVGNIPLGVFNVNEIKRASGYVKLVCIDSMTNFDKKISTSTHFWGTPEHLIKDCCSASGLGQKAMGYVGGLASFANINEQWHYIADTGESYRDVLESTLEIMGAFAVTSREVEQHIDIKKYGTTPVATFTPFNRFSLVTEDKLVDNVCASYKGVVTGSSSNIYSIDLADNKLLNEKLTRETDKESTDFTVPITEHCLKDISYVPCTIEYMGNPALDVGDMIKVNSIVPSLHQYTYKELETMTYEQLEQLYYGQISDYYQGEIFNAIIMQHNWVYRGKSTIYCYGKSAQLRRIYV